MKKVFSFFVTAILMVAFVACTGAKKTEAPAEQAVKTDTVAKAVEPQPAAPEVPAKSPADMLKDFQAYAKSYGEAFNNMTKDPNKFMDLSKLSQKWVDDMEKVKDQLTPKQLQDYKRACDIVFKVNKGGK
jgi:hypothetical protein